MATFRRRHVLPSIRSLLALLVTSLISSQCYLISDELRSSEIDEKSDMNTSSSNPESNV